MRSAMVTALAVCFLSAFSIVGQEPQVIAVSDFNRMLYLGMEASARTPFRVTETTRGRVLQFEMDRKRSVRTASFNSKTGEVYSECVIVGDRIYERSGSGGWTVSTRS